MERAARRTLIPALIVLVGVGFTGCTATKELLAVRQVQFHLNGVSGASVAGVPLDRVSSASDLGPTALARVGAAILTGEVPLEVTVHIEGRNPESNTVTARLVAMDWTCAVDDRDMVSGTLDEPYSFAPGRARDIPLLVRCDLLKFGNRRAALVDVALAMAGRNTRSHRVSLRLTPSIDTAMGRIRYPAPITLDIAAPESR